RAKAATHIGRDNTQLMLGRHPDEGRNHESRYMRVLGRIPERQVTRAGIIFCKRRAWLDRIRHKTIVDDIETGDMLGVGEGGINRLGIAERPFVDGILRRPLVNWWA